MYKPYLHVERLGSNACAGILNRKVEITAKVDGTNAVIWMEDGKIHCGSRKREISQDKDNAGFWAFCHSDDLEVKWLWDKLAVHPNYMIYGEWTGNTKFVGNIKAYDREALGHFYIFDVFDTERGSWLDGEYWRSVLGEFSPHMQKYFVQSYGIFDCPTMADIKDIAEHNHFLLPDDVIGEGVVIKPVGGWHNSNGDFTYGKYVRENYKKNKAAKKVKIDEADLATIIVDTFVPVSEVEKAMAKVALICQKEQFDPTSKVMIGRVFNMVFTDSICAECANIIKKFKYPTIDFQILKKACDAKVRSVIFGN